MFEAGKENKIRVIDAPVSGGEFLAKSGKLITMVGGEKESFYDAYELMKCYS